MRDIGAPEIILILLVVVLLFGAKKLPDLARGSGRALRIFKAETKGLMDDDEPTAEAKPLEASAPVAAPVAAPTEPAATATAPTATAPTATAPAVTEAPPAPVEVEQPAKTLD